MQDWWENERYWRVTVTAILTTVGVSVASLQIMSALLAYIGYLGWINTNKAVACA